MSVPEVNGTVRRVIIISHIRLVSRSQWLGRVVRPMGREWESLIVVIFC